MSELFNDIKKTNCKCFLASVFYKYTAATRLLEMQEPKKFVLARGSS